MVVEFIECEVILVAVARSIELANKTVSHLQDHMTGDLTDDF